MSTTFAPSFQAPLLNDIFQLAELINQGSFCLPSTPSPRASSTTPISTPPASSRGLTINLPRIDVLERSESITLLVDLPGLAKIDVELSLLGNELTLSGVFPPSIRGYPPSPSSETPSPVVEDIEEKSILTERPVGPFKRVIKLPKGTKVESVEAKMELGVLRVTVKKVVEKEVETRAIQIE